MNDIPYIDHPEIKINEHESSQMPFRYVKDENGNPVMPKVRFELKVLDDRLTRDEGMLDLIKKDSEKGFGDLF